jgi:hypothetical protein
MDFTNLMFEVQNLEKVIGEGIGVTKKKGSNKLNMLPSIVPR